MARQVVKSAESLGLKAVPDPVYALRLNDGNGNLRVAVKDVIDMADLPTRAGSRAFEDAPPAECDAAVIARLRQTDCRFVGKTQLHELAYGVTGLNSWTGAPENPAYPGLIPGGSSSGSAVAVARGDCEFALGTDTGGSVRLPAACCGLFGLKTTFGRISREGLTPAASSLDCIGPLTASADLLDAAMAAMDSSWAPLPDVSEARLGIVAADADDAEAVAAAVATLDSNAAAVTLPGLEAACDAGLKVIARETYGAFGHLLESGKVGPDVAGRLARAVEVTDAMLAEAEAVRAQFSDEVDAALDGRDALALPTLPHPPPRIADAGDLMAVVGITALVRPFNLSGHPAIAIPLRSTGTGPVSLQLVGRKGEDERLVALAAELERRHILEENTHARS